MTGSVINSRDNQYVKLARSLKAKKQREEQGMFLAEGVNNIREALKSPLAPEFLLCDADRLADERIAALMELAEARGAKVLPVNGRILAGAADTEANQGLLLAVRLPKLTAAEFAAKAMGKNIAVLDGLQDPGNVGTILRTAWAAGLGGVLLVNNSADAFAPKVVRAAMGATYHVPVLALPNDEAAALLADTGCSVAVADAGGEDFAAYKPAGPVAWLLGREATGPSAYFRALAANVVAIPMAAGVDSLNVAVAAGILFFSQRA